jgi:Transposase DDE domain
MLHHLIILSARLISKKTHDSPVLRTMLNRLKKCGVDLAGSIFNADRGYDGNKNFQSVFDMYIKQRKNARTNTE